MSRRPRWACRSSNSRKASALRFWCAIRAASSRPRRGNCCASARPKSSSWSSRPARTFRRDASRETETIRLGITPALMLIVGTEIAMVVRERLPGVSLSLVEAMSHVLTETLARGETDFILCYDVPDLPQVARMPTPSGRPRAGHAARRRVSASRSLSRTCSPRPRHAGRRRHGPHRRRHGPRAR